MLLDLVKFGFDLHLGAAGEVSEAEVEQVSFLGVEGVELRGELLVQQAGGGLLLAHDLRELRAGGGDEVRGELDGGVVLFDQVLDVGDAHVAAVARTVLPVAAEEVHVHLTAPVDRALNDYSSTAAGTVAASAEQAAFEVVVVDALAFLCGGAGGQDCLHLVEHLRCDERLVSPLVLLSGDADIAEVVPIAQHLRHLADRYLLRRGFRGGARA
nr:hypothetical protein [Amycolatopsis alkalitolerans]